MDTIRASLGVMWSDVIDLRDFYRTGIGRMARRIIRDQIRAAWPNAVGHSVLGLGYASPYLAPFPAAPNGT